MSFHESQTQSMVVEPRTGFVVGLRATHGTEYSLGTGKRWVIGSAPSCDVVVADPYVSAVHCIVERQPGGSLVVRDQGSRNGTRVNGSAVEGAELRVGSYLGIGRTTLVAFAARDTAQPRALELIRGHDPQLRATIEQARRAAHTDCNVLIVGETGTGKDLLARIIHEGSRRASGAFVAVNCGAIPRELVASELFGHEKGAFTGAMAERDGYFAEAHGGTIFLDELGELPIELQPHLLRVLETHRVRRVGGSAEKRIDVRIVAATNQLDGLGTETSRLRLDLYHRVATVVLALPPLRERLADLPELVDGMIADLAPEYGRKHVSEMGWAALATYDWPGNVRELRHAVARAVALGGEQLGPTDFFPDSAVVRRSPPRGTGAPDVAADPDPLAPYQSVLRVAMSNALVAHGSIRAAASHLGMPKSTFADKARAWGLQARRRRG
jgi:transcriptional regulator with PAS, ATPase and Fis domain